MVDGRCTPHLTSPSSPHQPANKVDLPLVIFSATGSHSTTLSTTPQRKFHCALGNACLQIARRDRRDTIGEQAETELSSGGCWPPTNGRRHDNGCICRIPGNFFTATLALSPPSILHPPSLPCTSGRTVGAPRRLRPAWTTGFPVRVRCHYGTGMGTVWMVMYGYKT